ncbi:MAG: hypothetical protein D6738_06785 [Acidobacteria bacterium]|nr:MAG: hypothetical protein D6738_06785 [Acidobacteriota bacterium]
MPWVMLLLAACAVTPSGPRRGAPAPAPAALPLMPDPGPASARPLAPEFEVLAAEAGRHGGFLRVLIDLRRQVDFGAVIARQARNRVPRSQARAETLALLESFSARETARVQDALDALIDEGLVEYYRPLRFMARVFVSARPAALERLRALPDVAAVIPEFDSVREARRRAGSAGPMLAPPVPPGDSWGIELLGLRALWDDGIDGRGVIVGSLDSGVIGAHDAFRGAESPRASWYDPERGSTRPTDSAPHGSHVLACALGRTVDGRALGAAPGARWAAALANPFNSYNNVTMSLATDWMIFDARPDVVLGAWGHGKASCDDRDRPLIEAMRATGIVPVFAAGNDGPDPASVQAPAGLPGWAPPGGGPLVVAAVDRDRRVIDASSRGPSPCGAARPLPDVAAPGWELPVPTGGGPRALSLASGTSMAVGWVGGVVALMFQVAPELPVTEAERIVRETARDLPPPGVDPASGYGLVDPARAVEAARAWRAR